MRAREVFRDLSALTLRQTFWLLCSTENLAVSDYGNLLSTGSTFLGWASVVALGIAWDARVKFKALLQTSRSDELGMLAAWVRRSRFWRTTGTAISGLSILLWHTDRLRDSRQGAALTSSVRPQRWHASPNSLQFLAAELDFGCMRQPVEALE